MVLIRRTFRRSGSKPVLAAILLAALSPVWMASAFVSAAASSWTAYGGCNGRYLVQVKSEIVFNSQHGGNGDNISRVRTVICDGSAGTDPSQPPGSLQTRYQSKLSGSLCTASVGWTFNSNWQSSLSINGSLAVNYCGAGYYNSYAWGNRWTGSSWIGNGSPGVTGGLPSGSTQAP